jgi:hypothetical protein
VKISHGYQTMFLYLHLHDIGKVVAATLLSRRCAMTCDGRSRRQRRTRIAPCRWRVDRSATPCCRGTTA